MPNRIVREGILSSDRVNALSCEAEVFYRRLMSKVDDHGTYDGRPSILLAHLYALRLDRVTTLHIEQWLSDCVAAGLLVAYTNAGKPYVHILNTQWKARSEARNPLPGDPASNCTQLQTSARLVVDVVVDVDVVDTPPDEPADNVGGEPPKAKGAIELDTWLAAIGEADAIPTDDPIFEWTERAGLPRDFLELAWHRFCEDMRERKTRKKDWRAHFRNAVRANWYKLWWTVKDGEYALTTTGEMTRRALA